MKSKTFLLSSLLYLALSACQTAGPNSSQDMGWANPFVSDVKGVQPKHLSADFWVRPGMDRILKTPAEIQAFNRKNTQIERTLYDISALPASLSQAELTAAIRSISNVPKYPRMYEDGREAIPSDFARYELGLNLAAISAENPVRFALTVKRTAIRTYPTADLLFSEGAEDRDIERFQESALFPGEAVAVLHKSADGQWTFIQAYNYMAWVPIDAIAIGSREEVLDYANEDSFLVVTGDKVRTVYNPEEPRVSELQLDMGVRVPLDRPTDKAHNLYGQNPYLSHMVRLPVRTEAGALDFRHALIPRREDVSIGYLPYTQENVVRQAFKFLGERYGWGHRFNGRDCTGFMLEIYKSFGIKLPRNSSDQGRSEIGVNLRFDDDIPTRDKVAALKASGQPGDILIMPGHVLMLLGEAGGEPFVIHDVHGYGHYEDDGSYYKGKLNGVSVTPLLTLQAGPERSYMDRIYNVKTVR